MNPRILSVYDQQEDAVTSVALADLAGDIRRYEVLGPADDTGENGSGK
jgi:hypothetical protein